MLNLFKKKSETVEVSFTAPLTGSVVPLEEVPDKVFAEKMMGDGVSIQPTDGNVLSPIDGEVVEVFKTKHAIMLRSKEGIEVLIHMGLDTVKLQGEGFEIKVQNGTRVKTGDQLGFFDLTKAENAGYKVITPLIILNSDIYNVVECSKHGEVKAGEDVIFKVYKK